MKSRPWLLVVWILGLALVAGEGIVLKSAAPPKAVSLKHYCEGWRVNVEVNNIREFEAVPSECADHIGSYMASAQYEADVRRVADEAVLYLATKFGTNGEGKDAWVFDVDDVLLSTLPYFKKHHFGAVPWCGGDAPDRSSLELWMQEGQAPAVENILNLFYDIKGRGLKIFIISSRGDQLRDATVQNLFDAGYSGWAELILRCGGDDDYNSVEEYKSAQRQKLVEKGYRIWGIVGDHWSSIMGQPSAYRIFKLPNPMYYRA